MELFGAGRSTSVLPWLTLMRDHRHHRGARCRRSAAAEHTLPALLRAGVRCSINADPLLFFTTLLREYELARHELGLDDDALAACAHAAVVCRGNLIEAAVAGIAA